MYIFITVSMQIRIKNCGTLFSGECAGPTVAALLGCMGWAGLTERESEMDSFLSAAAGTRIQEAPQLTTVPYWSRVHLSVTT